MTIQEAIKSGKPFKRKLWGYGWYEAIAEKDFQSVLKPRMIGYLPNSTIDAFCVSDLLAEDWEVKE